MSSRGGGPRRGVRGPTWPPAGTGTPPLLPHAIVPGWPRFWEGRTDATWCWEVWPSHGAGGGQREGWGSWPFTESATGKAHSRPCPGPCVCRRASGAPRPGLTTRGRPSSGRAVLPRHLGHPLPFQPSSPLPGPPASRSREKTRTARPGSCVPSAGGLWSRCRLAAPPRRPEDSSARLLVLHPPSPKASVGTARKAPMVPSQVPVLGWPDQRGSFWKCSEI